MAAQNPTRPDRYARPETGVDPQFLRDVAKSPPLKRSEIYDDGLLVDIKDTGVVTFAWKVYTLEGKRTLTIGRHDEAGREGGISLKTARAWKRRLQEAHRAGRLGAEEAALREALQAAAPEQRGRARVKLGASGATVDDVYERWFTSRVCAGSGRRRRPQDVADDYKSDVRPRIGHLTIREVTTHQLAEIIENMVQPRYGWRRERDQAAPVRAGKVLRLLKSLFAYAKRMDYLTRSDGLRIDPAADLERADLGVENCGQRDRWLTDEEIATVWSELSRARVVPITGKLHTEDRRSLSPVVVAALRFLMVVPVRTGTLLQARKSEFDLEAALWVSPAEHWKLTTEQLRLRTRSGLTQPFITPLSPAAVRLVRELLSIGGSRDMLVPPAHEVPGASPGLGQGSLSRALKDRFRDGHLKLPGGPCTPHDFRRTFSTHATPLGIPERVRELCLGHVYGSKVSRTYDCYEYVQEKREALDLWGSHVEKLVRPVALVRSA